MSGTNILENGAVIKISRIKISGLTLDSIKLAKTMLVILKLSYIYVQEIKISLELRNCAYILLRISLSATCSNRLFQTETIYVRRKSLCDGFQLHRQNVLNLSGFS